MSLGHGEIWWANVPGDKIRPVVILTRSRVAARLPAVVVAPVTSVPRGIPTEVVLGRAEGVRDGSVANMDNAMLLHRTSLGRKCGEVDRSRWPEFCLAVHKMMGCA